VSELSPLILALDVEDMERALWLVEETSEFVDVYKVGPILFVKYGPRIVEEVAKRGKKVFLDLKFHDIPNTVRKAVESASSMGVYLLTVHLSGGRRMLEAALSGKSHGTPLILGVSVLTSMDERDLREVGIDCGVGDQVARLVSIGKRAGIDGFVCSTREISLVKDLVPDALLVVPGVRPAGSSLGDQKRVATPSEAVKMGADFIVVGRPIYGAESPYLAARAIVEELSSTA